MSGVTPPTRSARSAAREAVAARARVGRRPAVRSAHQRSRAAHQRSRAARVGHLAAWLSVGRDEDHSRVRRVGQPQADAVGVRQFTPSALCFCERGKVRERAGRLRCDREEHRADLRDREVSDRVNDRHYVDVSTSAVSGRFATMGVEVIRRCSTDGHRGLVASSGARSCRTTGAGRSSARRPFAPPPRGARTRLSGVSRGSAGFTTPSPFRFTRKKCIDPYAGNIIAKCVCSAASRRSAVSQCSIATM